MTRVLQAMAGAQHGGAEAFFERLVPALHDAGLEQEVLIRRNPERAGFL
ncbi:MAG TPA: glycosyl transferase, partial [Rhodospirillaceae bacterium]|nr:glycosyl transferase [Rhodospirillaceae bacterium]